jgi:copper chaperone CopZ
MRKIMVLGVALLAFAAFVILPHAAYACNGSKAKTTTTVSADKTNATMVSAQGSTCSETAAKSSCSGGAMKSASADQATTIDAKYATARFAVKGMTCSSCEHAVTAALDKVDGVVKVEEVSHADGSAVVQYDPAKCNAESLAKAINAKGYMAEVIPAVATSNAVDGKVCPVTGKSCTAAEAAACKATCASKQAKADGTKATGSY